MEEKYHSLLQVNAKHVEMIEIFRQLKKQAMLFALRRLNDFLRAVPKERKLAWETTLTQSRIVSITFVKIIFTILRNKTKLNKQNLQRQNLESLYAQHFLAKINCNKCNIRSLILILIRNTIKRQTEKRENKPSGMKKIFRIALTVLGKQNVSSTIPLNLTLFCTKFLQVF